MAEPAQRPEEAAQKPRSERKRSRPMPPKWFAVHCAPQYDRQVERLLQQHDIQAYSPRIPKTRRRNGDKPLFPGYLFARLDLSSGIWGQARFFPGVRSIVQSGGEPCPVDDGVVEAIRRRISAWVDAQTNLRPGMRVRVINGTFQHFEGLFCETLSGEQRVAVLIDMMRRQVRVELEADSIRPLEPSAA